MSAEDFVTLLIPLTWLAMLGIEALGTGRSWPAARWWRVRSLGFFVMVMTLNAALPGLLPEAWTRHHLLDAARLGLAGNVLAGFAALTLATATLHRAYHRFDLLWRWVHQLHHAPQRLDVAGGVVFTPWEVVLNVAIFQGVIVFVLGSSPLAAAIVGYVSVFYGLFQHFNIHTPTWLGYLIQRPESHGVHHRRGLHGYNYADLPLWDMLWGTFRNPRQFNGDVGFEGGEDPPVWPQMLGRDANAGRYGRGNRGRPASVTNPA